MTTTILTPTYNKPDFLPACIDSVLTQTRVEWNWWIVLDGADPTTTDIVYNLAANDERVKVIEEKTTPEERQRVYRPAVIFNTYAPQVTTKYFAFLADDDVLYPHFLETLVGYLDANPGVDVCYGVCEVANQVGPDQWETVNYLGSAPVYFYKIYSPDFQLDGGQILQTTKSLRALYATGFRMLESGPDTHHCDGIYLRALCQLYPFHPVARVVMRHRRTYLSHNSRVPKTWGKD